MNPTISIVNRSRSISDAEVKRNLVALQKQITRDFEPVWGWGANLVFDAPHFNMKIVIRDHAASGDLGYHIEGDKPVGYIFAADDIEDAGEYTSTLSHELLEMIADPNVNLYAAGPFLLKNRRRVGFFALEVCDPVQENYYTIDGVRVQDFVFPEWFEQNHKKGAMKMNHMETINAPFTAGRGRLYRSVLERQMALTDGIEGKTQVSQTSTAGENERYVTPRVAQSQTTCPGSAGLLLGLESSE